MSWIGVIISVIYARLIKPCIELLLFVVVTLHGCPVLIIIHLCMPLCAAYYHAVDESHMPCIFMMTMTQIMPVRSSMVGQWNLSVQSGSGIVWCAGCSCWRAECLSGQRTLFKASQRFDVMIYLTSNDCDVICAILGLAAGCAFMKTSFTMHAANWLVFILAIVINCQLTVPGSKC